MNYQDGLKRLAGNRDYSVPEHQPITNQDLERLKRQIDVALSIPESAMRPLNYTDIDRVVGLAKYGPGAVCIGDFVIKRR